MANIVPFNKSSVPATLGTGMFDTTPDLVVAGGFPVLSIKGKVFHILRGDDKELVTREVDGDEIAAPSLEVVIVDANRNVSKTYYEDGYTEGSTEKPDCYSDDGVAPATDAQTPQSKSCAACVHNQWGSRISESGAKAKSCADLRRIAVASPDLLDDPMLLRIPATSLRPLGEYQSKLSKHGAAIQEVVTRVGFDPTVAHPSLTFKPVGFMSDRVDLLTIKETMDSSVVKQILGLAPTAAQIEKAAEPATRDNLIEGEPEADEEVEVPAEAELTSAQKAARTRKRNAEAKKKDKEEQAAKQPKVEVEAESEDNDESDLIGKATAALEDIDDFEGFEGFDD